MSEAAFRCGDPDCRRRWFRFFSAWKPKACPFCGERGWERTR